MKHIFILILIGACSLQLDAQNLVSINSRFDQLLRIEDLSDTSVTSTIRRLKWDDTGSLKSRQFGERFYVHPASVEGFFNSKYARSFNDGPVWAGKGISTAITAGVSYRVGGLEITAMPTFTHSQNDPYALQTPQFNSPNGFRYPWYSGIDLPQRFGDGSLTKIYPGQSRIKYSWKNKFYAKLSSENMWWGPSHQNSILMTNTAPGFPHFSIGTEGIQPTKLGGFGFGIYWGRFQESEFYDNDGVDAQYFNGLTLEYQPNFVDGLTVGFGRVIYKRWSEGSMDLRDYLIFLGNYSVEPDSITGNDEYDQLASLFLRWKFPEVGFEAYFEFARNDFGGDLQNLVISQPDHSRFYTIGFSKLIPSSVGKIRFLGEFSTFSRSNTRFIGPSPVLYVHNIGGGGYTHNGQLVGAAVGPGANTQTLGVDIVKENKNFGLKLMRISYNDDYFFDNLTRNDPSFARDVETSLDGVANWIFDKTSVEFNPVLSVRNNWYYTRSGNVTNFFMRIKVTRAF